MNNRSRRWLIDHLEIKIICLVLASTLTRWIELVQENSQSQNLPTSSPSSQIDELKHVNESKFHADKFGWNFLAYDIYSSIGYIHYKTIS